MVDINKDDGLFVAVKLNPEAEVALEIIQQLEFDSEDAEGDRSEAIRRAIVYYCARYVMNGDFEENIGDIVSRAREW